MTATRSTGCMYVYDSAVAIVIHAVDQYHAVGGLGLDGCNSGITFLASASGNVTDTADNGGVLRCESVAHGLTTGNYLSLVGMGDGAHVGFTRVSVVDVDTFDCDNIVYSSSGDTGFWDRGSSLTVDQGKGGLYNVAFSASVLSAGNNKNYKFELMRDTTELNEFAAERRINVAGDLGSISAAGLVGLTGGDTVWLVVENTTDATNLTLKHANVHMFRI
jgi:hypothetical protein